MSRPLYDLGNARGRINYAIGGRAPAPDSEAFRDREYLVGMVDGFAYAMGEGEHPPRRDERARQYRLKMALHHTGPFGRSSIKYRDGYPMPMRGGDDEGGEG